MAKHVVLFTDAPSAGAALRRERMPAHLAFLEAHADRIEAAGPLHAPSGEGAGGLWIVEAEDEAAVERLIREDPFWPTGLRESHRILVWTRVFARGARLVDPG